MNHARKIVRDIAARACLVAAAMWLCAAVAIAVTRYVSPAGSHSTPFTTWATAATNIAAAVNICVPNDVVLVTNGVYRDASQINLNDDGLRLASVNGPAATVIDGLGSHRVLYSDNQGVVVDGFTISNGYVNGNGAGVWLSGNAANRILLTNCVIEGCVTAGNNRQGAGVYANLANIVSCRIFNNRHAGTGGLGGGLYFTGAGSEMRDTTVENNTGARNGGGVYCAAAVTMRNCSVKNNTAQWFGGGVYVNDNATELAYSSFEDNETTVAGSGRGGGGVYAGNNAYIHHCGLSRNIAANDGGGVLMDNGGRVAHCRLMGNTAGDWGGGIGVYDQGSITNCLITGNNADEGGGVYADATSPVRMDSCTVAHNEAQTGAGGIDCDQNAAVYNCIAYHNTAPVYTNYRNQASNERWYYCCTHPTISGAANAGGNITNAPLFVAADEGLYQVSGSSPCIDNGTNIAWMTGDEDLTPQSRIINGRVDMGAYEAGKLWCYFRGTPVVGAAPLSVAFTSWVVGTNTAGLNYYWDFAASLGAVSNGLNLDSVTWNYVTDGIYTVSLSVSNAAGEAAVYARTNYIYVMPSVRYVATNGAHIAPFTSWAHAATNIESAVGLSLDGMKVYVSGGTYRVGTAITCTNAVTIESVEGYARTIVDGLGTTRAFTVLADAVVAGFTCSNCAANGVGLDGYGGGAFLHTYGTLSNCHIMMSMATYGGGAACYGGGKLDTCLLSTNRAQYGGGIATYGPALIEQCVMWGNYAVSDGGGLYADTAATIRNCLGYYNVAATNGGGMEVRNSAVGVQNCTVAHNHATQGGGMHTLNGGNVYNTIIYFNTATTAARSNWYSNTSGTEYGRSFEYCATAPTAGLPGGTGCINTDPRFRAAISNNFRLLPYSPCINAGLNFAWMSSGVDLDHLPRLREGRVDMGAYESILAYLMITNMPDGTAFPFRHLFQAIAGSSTGLLGVLTYSNRWTDGYQSGTSMGTAAASSEWNTIVQLPHHGEYTFTISGTNPYNDVLQDTVRFRRKKQSIHTLR